MQNINYIVILISKLANGMPIICKMLSKYDKIQLQNTSLGKWFLC